MFKFVNFGRSCATKQKWGVFCGPHCRWQGEIELGLLDTVVCINNVFGIKAQPCGWTFCRHCM